MRNGDSGRSDSDVPARTYRRATVSFSGGPVFVPASTKKLKWPDVLSRSGVDRPPRSLMNLVEIVAVHHGVMYAEFEIDDRGHAGLVRHDIGHLTSGNPDPAV